MLISYVFSSFFNPQIILNSMHKFQPRIHLVMVGDEWNTSHGIDLTGGMKHKTFIFDITAFTAVTAYQNQLVSTIYHIEPVSCLTTFGQFWLIVTDFGYFWLLWLNIV